MGVTVSAATPNHGAICGQHPLPVFIGAIMITCQVCGESFTEQSFPYHLRKHRISPKEYYIRYISLPPKCRCGKETRFLSISKGFNKSCGDTCARLNSDYSKAEERRKVTKLAKYGDENYNNREGSKNTLIEKYGVENSKKIPGSMEKDRLTRLKRYGDENYRNHEKGKKTFFEKYGVESNILLPDIREKAKKKQREMFEMRNKWVPWNKRTELEKYRWLVRIKTESNMKQLAGIEKRSRDFHVDHKFSIHQGFIEKIDPDIIASIHNLEIISGKENLSKGNNCSITKEELLEKYNS